MGAWGAGSFENDDAGDWAWSFEEEGLAVIESAFGALQGAGYLEGSDGSVGVAAAETVAAALGQPGNGYTEEFEAAVKRHAGAVRGRPGIADAALQTLDRVTGPDSELAELWAESDSETEWQASIADLRRRLTAAR